MLYSIPKTDEGGRLRKKKKNPDYKVMKFTKLGPFFDVREK